MCEPELVAPGTYVVRQLAGEGMGPVATYVNSSVIVGAEPVLIDVGPAVTRRSWMDTTFSLVDPGDVRWIYLSHDDVDHVGNLLQVLDACPSATLVTTWFMVERMSAEFGLDLPMDRMLWLNDGEAFVAGDRALVAHVPPTFDSPTTRGLLDTSTGVYWASDSMGTPVPHEVRDIDELDAGFWRDGFLTMQRILSPWHRWLDPARFGAHLDGLRKMGVSTVTSAHGPTLRGAQVHSAFNLLGELPHLPAAPLPGQADLEAMLASMTASSGAPFDAAA
jgi:flavorubredoxin